MATGRPEGFREVLWLLGRAAGLSSLTLATLASGPCGTCTTGNDCATVGELLATREKGIADAAASSSAGSSAEAMNVATAQGWDGMACPTPEQYRSIVQLKLPNRYWGASLSVSDLVSGKCCYHFEESDCGEGGRPFLVHGHPRVASLASNVANASAWLADAQVEHASVAAFARLSLQLLALGAPAELVRDAQLASLDELRHADFFFDLASREAGAQLRPGPLDVAGALDDLSLAALVESNLREGCIGETVAAEHLRRRAQRTSEPELRAGLWAIADDETRHAALAFRILAWCRDTAPELTRSRIQRVLDGEQHCDGTDETWQYVLSPLLGALTAGAEA
jgi:hypothetical protein